MFAKITGFLVVVLVACVSSAAAQGEKKTTGSTVGVVQSQKNTPDNKNTFIEVLAPGEEKARSYHVMHDAKLKGPNPKLLAAVRAAQTGDRVEIEWTQTGHGPAITAFKVERKSPAPK